MLRLMISKGLGMTGQPILNNTFRLLAVACLVLAGLGACTPARQDAGTKQPVFPSVSTELSGDVVLIDETTRDEDTVIRALSASEERAVRTLLNDTSNVKRFEPPFLTIQPHQYLLIDGIYWAVWADGTLVPKGHSQEYRIGSADAPIVLTKQYVAKREKELYLPDFSKLVAQLERE
jgi:hypothetical protein